MFLFKPELQVKIIQKKKWQTRRLIKKGETLRPYTPPAKGESPRLAVYTGKGRVKHYISQVNAVPYAYQKPTAWWEPATQTILPIAKCQKKVLGLNPIEAYQRLQSEGYIQLLLRITALWKADARAISYNDAVAEGFADKRGFLGIWHELNCPKNPSDKHYHCWAYEFLLLEG